MKIRITGLFKKLLVYQLLLLSVIIFFLFFTLSVIEKNFWGEYLIKEATEGLRLLNPMVMRSFGKGIGREKSDQEVTVSEIKVLLKDKAGVTDISVIDSDGRYLFRINDFNLPAVDLRDYIRYKDVLHREINFQGKKFLDILVPFQTMGRSNFFIRYIMYFPAIESQIANINKLLLAAAIIASLIAFILSYYYVRRIVVPIEILKDKARAIRQGDMLQEIPELEDEIGELADALKAMVGELKKKQDELMLQNERINEAFNEVLFLQNRMLNYEKFAALGKMSAGMSHEIDNPLGIIIGHAEYLKGELAKDSPHQEDVDTILRESLRIKNILRSLLSFAKPKESKIKTIELSSFVKKIADDFSFQKIFRKIRLTYTPLEVYVKADEEKFHQVVVNVIINAIQAMPAGGDLFIVVETENGWGVVKITDTGEGIPDELKNKIFDLFFSTKKDGTGLGLAVSKNFMEEMGGEIRIESNKGGKTTAALYLPPADKLHD